MALQGTLETFSVPEVLRLLSGTRKTGLLALDGDRGAAKVWMDNGVIVGARSDHEPEGDVDSVLFDLLRFEEGSFVFETDAALEGGAPKDIDVEKALVRAEQLMEDWREIESVVPSLRVWVSMAPTVDGDVTVTAEQWASLAVIGRGTSGHRLDDELRLGELETSRRIRDLVQAGLVEVDAATVETDAESDAEPEAVVEPEAPVVETRSEDTSDTEASDSWTRTDDLSVGLAGFVARGEEPDPEPQAEIDVVAFEDEDEVEDEVEVDLAARVQDDDMVLPDLGFDELDGVEAEVEEGDEVAETAPEPAADADRAEDDDEPDEFLSQLANLSPKAAAAIEATASESEATRNRSSAEADEEINRNLLLKFLSSSKP